MSDGILLPTETVLSTDPMVQLWVKPTKSRSGITSGARIPKKHHRSVKAKAVLPLCKGKNADKGPCRLPEKPLPYCKPGQTPSYRRACRPIEHVYTYKKKSFRDLIPPQYRLNPPTPKKDTFFQAPSGSSQAILWDLFKTDSIPITNFAFMRHFRKEFSGFEYNEYEARRADRQAEEREKLWINSWKEKDDSLFAAEFLDPDRSALTENERLYKKIRKKLDDTPIAKNVIPKLHCRPIRLVEPFAAEAEVYYRNLDKLPKDQEKFKIPLTSMKNEATDEYLPPGYPVKSGFYSSIQEESLESRKPEPIPPPPDLTYVLHLLPENFEPKVKPVRKFKRKVEKVFEKRNEEIPGPEDHSPEICEILNLEDTDYGQGHSHLQDGVGSDSVPSEAEEDEDTEEEHPITPASSGMYAGESVAGSVDIHYEKAKEILKTMRRKALAADDNLKARMMKLRQNKAIED